jgi:hypothetical protein
LNMLSQYFFAAPIIMCKLLIDDGYRSRTLPIDLRKITPPNDGDARSPEVIEIYGVERGCDRVGF